MIDQFFEVWCSGCMLCYYMARVAVGVALCGVWLCLKGIEKVIA